MTMVIFFLSIVSISSVNRIFLIGALLDKTTLSLTKISLQTSIGPLDQYPIRGDYMKLSLAFYLIPCILEPKLFQSHKKT